MKTLFFTLILLLSLNANANSPLVDATWLNQHLNDDGIVLLDIRTKDYFDYVHIPNSVHSNYAKWRQPKTKVLRQMLPSKISLESLLSTSGIKESSHIVIISSGETASDLASASRVYWTLEQIGHDKKSILNGGIIAWATQKLPLTQSPALQSVKTNYSITSIKAQLTSDDVVKAIKNNTQMIDTRSVAEHKGIIVSVSDERRGTIKTSKSLPYDWLSLNGSGSFQNPKNIYSITKSINYDNDSSAIIYCHTGHRAALSWFVLHELLGNKSAQLYDGSTRDWATNPKLPMTSEIKIGY